MKKITLTTLVCFIFLGLKLNAQTTAIPDIKFEEALIALNLDTGTPDGTVPTANINTITSLNVSSKSISDLTGIEDFTALTTLYCYSNSLSSLDFSSNTSLTTLYCGSNSLISLDVSNNIALTTLSCTNSGLSNLDVSSNTSLTTLYCGLNSLTTLNISNNTALTYLSCESNSLSSLDVSGNTALTSLICISNNLNILDVSNNTALTYLSCGSNSLSSLDVSSNTSLLHLDCNNNSLSSLDVSSNTALTKLFCYLNSLSSLDVSNNTALTTLYCSLNSLSSLDVSGNTALTILSCSLNSLSSLNLQNGNNSNMSNFSNFTNNPDLTCIQVDDVAYSDANWASRKDGIASYSTNCHYNETYVPDDNFEQALIDLGYDSGPLDDYVPTASINTITSLDVGNKDISDLTGIEDFTALTALICSDNNLSSLDFSSNTSLFLLLCSDNNLSSLDVSNNTALIRLYCYSNSLSVLDVSNNTALTFLSCSSNSLISLNVNNGNNSNFTTFSATDNPNLTCIQVDDVTASNGYSNWSIDAIASYNTNCGTLNTEDAIVNTYQFYPNPVKDVLNLKLENDVKLKQVVIYNTTGQLVNTSKQLKIDTTNLTSGLYFIEVETNQGKSAKKIVVE